MGGIKQKVIIQIDGKEMGAVRVARNASERRLAKAACGLPGVLDKLRKDGVAAAKTSKPSSGSWTYNILTQYTEPSPEISDAPSEGKRSWKIKRSPFEGLGISPSIQFPPRFGADPSVN